MDGVAISTVQAADLGVLANVIVTAEGDLDPVLACGEIGQVVVPCRVGGGVVDDQERVVGVSEYGPDGVVEVRSQAVSDYEVKYFGHDPSSFLASSG
jgi:hypothetical protein